MSQGRRAFAAVTDTTNGVLYAAGGWVGTYLANVEFNRVPADVPWLSEAPTTGTLNPAAVQPINVTFNATGLAEGTYYAQLKTTSNTPYNYTSIPVTLIVTSQAVFGVSVSPNTTLTGNPGATVSKTITVTNTGTTTDTFNLSHTSVWTMSMPASVGPLAPGASASVTVQVTIPANATNGASDVGTIVATSQGDSTKTASMTITTTASVGAIHGVNATASPQAQSAAPGTVVNYTLTVTNTGNTVDSFTVVLSGNGWTTTRTPTSISNLAAGQSTTVTVQVTIPANAAANATDTVTVKVTSQADATKSSTVSLTTTASRALFKIYMPFIIR
jgi:uncharacterized membrane protein